MPYFTDHADNAKQGDMGKKDEIKGTDGRHDAGDSGTGRRRATDAEKAYKGAHRSDEKSIRNHRTIDPRDQSR